MRQTTLASAFGERLGMLHGGLYADGRQTNADGFLGRNASAGFEAKSDKTVTLLFSMARKSRGKPGHWRPSVCD